MIVSHTACERRVHVGRYLRIYRRAGVHIYETECAGVRVLHAVSVSKGHSVRVVGALLHSHVARQRVLLARLTAESVLSGVGVVGIVIQTAIASLERSLGQFGACACRSVQVDGSHVGVCSHDGAFSRVEHCVCLVRNYEIVVVAVVGSLRSCGVIRSHDVTHSEGLDFVCLSWRREARRVLYE